jgi:hypothetical protein
VTQTSRLGQAGTFVWDAIADQAISDDARFRITVVPQNSAGPVQRAATSAISPPFRVRALTCLWPDGPSFSVNPTHPLPGQFVEFRGWVTEASGVLTYTWDFGDGTPPVTGQVVKHRFAADGTYTVKLGRGHAMSHQPPGFYLAQPARGHGGENLQSIPAPRQARGRGFRRECDVGGEASVAGRWAFRNDLCGCYSARVAAQPVLR